MALKAYGIKLEATAKNAGSTLIIEESLAVGMTSPTTIFTKTGAKAGTVYPFTRTLPNDGVTRFYRATESLTGYASASSSVVSGTPQDLSLS